MLRFDNVVLNEYYYYYYYYYYYINFILSDGLILSVCPRTIKYAMMINDDDDDKYRYCFNKASCKARHNGVGSVINHGVYIAIVRVWPVHVTMQNRTE